MNPAKPPVQPGEILAGKYRVERVLGTGGMGVVVAATHIELLETRAIKFMLSTALADQESVDRFQREARAASLLKSEYVARVYDVGRLEDGAPYMVMEYLEGADLSATLKRSGALPLGEAVLYVLQASEALAEAHSRGIVHRDVKPANLFLTMRPDGTPCIKVLDFGISKMAGADSPELDLTKTHAVLGSPQYMSPEQMHSTRSVDGRSDIWSLGVILYQLITQKLPFRGRNITELVANVLGGAPPPPSEIAPGLPPALDRVILRCLERDVSRRYATVGELAQDLLPFLPGAVALVDSIQRLVCASSRSGSGMPAVLVDSQRLMAAASQPSAWGRTETGVALGAPRRSRAVFIAALGAAMLVGALIAWSFAGGGDGDRVADGPATGPTIVVAASTPPAPVLVEPSTPAPAETASARATSRPAPSAPTPVTTGSPVGAPVTTGSPVGAPKAPVRDPFGMDRK